MNKGLPGFGGLREMKKVQQVAGILLNLLTCESVDLYSNRMILWRTSICAYALSILSNGSSVHASSDSAGVTEGSSLIELQAGPARNNRLISRKKSAGIRQRSRRAQKVLANRHAHIVPSTKNLVVAEPEVVPASSAFVGVWSEGDWGACQVNCGTGSMYRPVVCADKGGNTIADVNCDTASRPTSRKTCEGDCVKCDVNSQFLKGMGAVSMLTAPMKKPADTAEMMCVVNSAFTCCSQSVEQQLLIAHYQLRRGLKAQTQHRDVTVDRVNAAYSNISDILSTRVDQTTSAMDKIVEAIDNEPADKNGDSTTLSQLRQSLLTVLNQRTDSIYTAQSDLATAQSELLEQLDKMNSLPEDDVEDPAASSADGGVMAALADITDGWFSSSGDSFQNANFDDSDLSRSAAKDLPATFMERRSVSTIHYDTARVNATSFLQTRGEGQLLNFSDPTLRVASKQCTNAISNYFISLSCAGCNPAFPIQARAAPETPLLEVPAATCTGLYSDCADSLVEAHGHMTEAIKALLNSHGNLITLVSQIQPILDRVWGELRFDWLPGLSALQVAKPDLTKMACVEDLRVFTPFEVVTSNDFCNAYFTFASPKAFLKRIGNQIDRGLFAMAKFTSCDRCVHDTVLFLSDVLSSSGKGSLRLTLPTRAQAMLSSCGAAPSVAGSSHTTVSAGIMTPFGKMTTEERISPRVRFALPSESVKGFEKFVNVTQSIVDTATNAPPHEWRNRTLKMENSTIRAVPVAKDSLRPAGPDASLQIRVMNQACTKHSECYHQDAPSGMRPWWFCAHPNVCTEQPGSCSAEAEAMLATGPKCVRGPCSSDLAAIDKKCPVNAVCPAQVGSLTENPAPYFGPDYFAKFDLKIRDDDPLSIGKGVCDCAFDANGAITDKCMYARCLAYASVLENAITCNTGLVAQCVDIKLNNAECTRDDTLSCSDKDLILTYPPDIPGECRVNDFALASDTAAAGFLPTAGALILSLVVAAVLL